MAHFKKESDCATPAAIEPLARGDTDGRYSYVRIIRPFERYSRFEAIRNCKARGERRSKCKKGTSGSRDQQHFNKQSN